MGSNANSPNLYIQGHQKFRLRNQNPSYKEFPMKLFHLQLIGIAQILGCKIYLSEYPTMRRLQMIGLQENLVETEISATFLFHLHSCHEHSKVFDLTKVTDPVSGNIGIACKLPSDQWPIKFIAKDGLMLVGKEEMICRTPCTEVSFEKILVFQFKVQVSSILLLLDLSPAISPHSPTDARVVRLNS